MNIVEKAAGVVAIAVALTASAQAQEVPVGVGMALTGNYAFAGVPVTNGVRVAAEEINATNFLNGRKIKLIVQDNASDKNQIITLINRFATVDNAVAVIGPLSSLEALAAAPVANEKGIVMISTGVSPDILKAGPWSFKVMSPPAVTMRALAEYAVDNLKAKRAALLSVRDNDGFITPKNAVRDYFKSRGVEVVLEDSVAASDVDFTAISTKLANANPDVVFFAMPAEQGASLVVQARQAGLAQNVRFLGPQAMSAESLIRIGGKAVEGSIIAADYFVGAPGKQNSEFVERHRKMFNKDPENWTGVGYTMMYLVATAIKNAGPGADREKIRKELTALKDVPTVLGNGKYSLDGNRDAAYGAALVTVKDGKFALAPR
jgi:branched-chain amino acid transport system substrate-binding protein